MRSAQKLSGWLSLRTYFSLHFKEGDIAKGRKCKKGEGEPQTLGEKTFFPASSHRWVNVSHQAFHYNEMSKDENDAGDGPAATQDCDKHQLLL